VEPANEPEEAAGRTLGDDEPGVGPVLVELPAPVLGGALEAPEANRVERKDPALVASLVEPQGLANRLQPGEVRLHGAI
jgi:hypothetical protein